jgi:hypothetical protein
VFLLEIVSAVINYLLKGSSLTVLEQSYLELVEDGVWISLWREFSLEMLCGFLG